MIIHYLRFLFREMRKNAVYSLINIAGLAAGIAAVLFIAIYVFDEYRFDRFHVQASQIYRAVSTIHSDADELETAFSPAALFESVKTDFPEVEFASRVNYFNEKNLRYGEKLINIQGIDADPDFLRMFSFALKEGDSRTALNQPNAIVVTEDLAQRLFGQEEALYKVIKIGQDRDAIITGVLKDVPYHSHLQFSFITPYSYLEKVIGPASWGNIGQYTYIKIHEGTSHALLQDKLQDVFADNLKKLPGLGDMKISLTLQGLTDIHAGRVDYQMERPGKGNKEYIVIFSLLAVFILLIGCINFANLNTAKSIRRAKEIGLRKTIGAVRSQLVLQLLGESLAAAIFSFAIALVIVALLLSSFNTLVQKDIGFNYNSMFVPVAMCIVGTIFAGIIAGIYPALVLSSITPSALFKGAGSPSGGISKLSKALVVVQFAASIGVVAATFVIYSQLQYIRGKNLGFDRENVLHVHGVSNDYTAFKTALGKHSGILSVATANQNLLDVFLASEVMWPGKQAGQRMLIHDLAVDQDFFETLKIDISQGRAFDESTPADSSSILINETALRLLPFSEPLGQKLSFGKITYTIIGVVKDFHFRSIHEKVGPIGIIQGNPFVYRDMMIRMQGNMDQNVQTVAAAWKALNPGKPFEFSFMDDDFEAIYRAEAVTDRLCKYFSALAILIACLGLFGLSSYAAERNRKEYAVRKVMGASVSGLFLKASFDHLIMVGIALLISIPVSAYLMLKWLDGFAYHIDLSIVPFCIAGVGALVMAFLTVSYQAAKASRVNPSVTLKSE
jgi:putative ABC transport system permease protein